MQLRRRSLLLLFTLTILAATDGMCATLPEILKRTTLVVVIPDEEEKIFSNLMDAVEDNWKFSSYKFMTIKDAKELYSNNDYVFMQLVTMSTTINAEKGALNLSLKRGKLTSEKDLNRLTELYTMQLSTKEGAIYCTMDHVPAAAVQRMYFFTCDFIASLKNDNAEVADGNITFYCPKEDVQNRKDTIAKKTILLMDKDEVPATGADERNALIRKNLNTPDLKIMIVDFEDIDMAFKKKDNNTLVSVGGQLYSCGGLEKLCATPASKYNELTARNKRTKTLRIVGWVASTVVAAGYIVAQVMLN